jgi:hypothetical protein
VEGLLVGFVCSGWAYMFLCFCPGLDEKMQPGLLTTTLLNVLYGRLSHDPMSEGEAVWIDVLNDDNYFKSRIKTNYGNGNFAFTAKGRDRTGYLSMEG